MISFDGAFSAFLGSVFVLESFKIELELFKVCQEFRECF
jgi:hypothetical protein